MRKYDREKERQKLNKIKRKREVDGYFEHEVQPKYKLWTKESYMNKQRLRDTMHIL